MPAPEDSFYLGRIYNIEKSSVTTQPLYYDPADLTTHGIVTGMTGSGKTGMCIGLLEEAALKGIPAIIVDPKGDLTNLLLHFPDLLPSDFKPWLDPEAARRLGKSADELAADTAALWKKGLADWEVPPERLRALQQAVHFAVYTPGSDAGLPVSILASLKVPPIPWEGNREVLREEITSTVTALLGLVGVKDIDPVRSREHILLSNIFEQAWSQGRDLDLTELILQTQSPPFTKLGVFPIETFFPDKDRMSLAMLLNNFLAAPAFQTWMEGQPLDIPTLLYAADGTPRHSIFYIAHLSDAERMFFVTLLFSAVETWMRTQTGTSGLRALIYFDEVLGYLPAVSNPPSKEIMLRMLKQARAFGVGLLLATQNPIDVDYKALSNAGSWFIGKLQTDQDKQRLLDGLESAAGGIDRSAYDKLISTLNKRVFLLNNVHAKGPVLFQTRWVMNYLAGPLTRSQVPALNQLVGASAPAEQPVVARPTPAAPVTAAAPVQPAAASAAPQANFSTGSETRPALPSGVAEYFMPSNVSLSDSLKAHSMTLPATAETHGIIFRPAVLGQVLVRYLARQYNLDEQEQHTVLVTEPDRRGMVRWDDFPFMALDPASLEQPTLPNIRYGTLDAPLTDTKLMSGMQKDFLDWAYRTSTIKIRANQALKVYAGPQTSTAQFRDQCSQAARGLRDQEVEKASSAYDRKLAALQQKLTAEERELKRDEDVLSQRKMEELGTHAENILSLFGGRKRTLTTSLTKRRLTEQSKANVTESVDAISDYKKQIDALEKEKTKAVTEVNDRWARTVDDVSEIPVTPYKKDVLLDLFGVVWLPYYSIRADQRDLEIPAYRQSA